MNSLPLNTKGAASEYLRSLKALASEIVNAMNAIADNSPEQVKASVSMQEMLCAEATTMANSLMELARVDASELEPAIKLDIKKTQEEVDGLIQRYRALLQHSEKSIAVLSTLCNSYGRGTSRGGYPVTAHQTWSCEV